MLAFNLLSEPLWGTSFFFVFLVQNIFAHKGEGSFLPEHSQDLSFHKLPKKDHFR